MAERIAVSLPQIFPECSQCEFAKRAAQQARTKFPHTEDINLECEFSGGGGSRQISPGEWVEYKSRTIKATPTTISSGVKSEHAVGQIPTCPVDIENSPEEYPSLPILHRYYTDTL